MKLQDISIKNFRGICSLDLPLDNLTVLIGENNVGKSTILEALKFALTRGLGTRQDARFTEYDFHLKDATATPQNADPIEITVHFAEVKEDEWPEVISQKIDEVIQLDATTGLNHIWLQVHGTYDATTSSFGTRWAFLDMAGNELSLKNATPHNIFTSLVPIFFLSAIRNAGQEFGQRGQFWKSFLKNIELEDETRHELESMLQDINSSVIAANKGLDAVIHKIAQTQKLVPLATDNPVILEAIPTRVFDMVGKIQVYLKSCYGAKLPLHRHGEGTQSLAVLMLFEAFTVANLSEVYTPESTPLLALEEPEAHLHPSAVRALGSFLKELTGQVIVTSHSGDLLSRVSVNNLCRLYKKHGETMVGRVNVTNFEPRELQAIDYNICLAKGHYLFSRCWLFVEGESDYHLMPLLFKILGYSLDEYSFSIIEISQIIDKGEPLMKLANELGIEWYLMADGDTAGQGYVSRATKHLKAGETINDRAKNLAHADIEHEFWHNGYQSFIESKVSSQRMRAIPIEAARELNKEIKSKIQAALKSTSKKTATVQALTSEITTQRIREIPLKVAGMPNKETKLKIKAALKETGGKPAFAQALANEIATRGSNTIPQTIKDVIEKIVHMCGD